MPKDRRVTSSSCDQAMASPYSRSSRHSDNGRSGTRFPIGDKKEWNEARCPICMEHPHNSVLLICSCHEKGCRPFMCDTSYRHSNCLDQFRKSPAAASSNNASVEKRCEFVCPLCRGVVSRWIVIEEARSFMNSKKRSCSVDSCDFVGDYAELRKHARLEHPGVRPSVASPTQRRNWTALEQQLDMEDALAHQFDIDYNWDDWPTLDDIGHGELLSDDSFLDLPSGLSDAEDEFFGLGGESFSFSSYFSSTEEEADSGSSSSSDGFQTGLNSANSSSRLNNQGGDALPASHSQSTDYREGSPVSRLRSVSREISFTAISRSVSNHHREDANTSVRTRSGYYRDNASTSQRSNNQGELVLPAARSLSSYFREASPLPRLRSIPEVSYTPISRSNLNNHHQNTNTNRRPRSDYYRDIGSTSSRPSPSYNSEFSPSSSSHRSSHRRGDAQPNSGASSRRNRSGVTPPGRRSASR